MPRRLYVHKLTVDNGGAPCVDRHLLTLAICEPMIRTTTRVGDVLFGLRHEPSQPRQPVDLHRSRDDLGTGMGGRAFASRLAELGHDVRVGSRTAGDDRVPFAEAAAHGELIFNCTAGRASLNALAAAGEDNLAGRC